MLLSADVLTPDVRTFLADLAAWPRTVTGRPAYLTRKRRPRTERPRIARRIVPQHSAAILLDWDLSPSARLCLQLLLTKPRQGCEVYGVTAGGLAAQLGACPRSGWRWLHALEAEEYIRTRPGRLRGTLVVTLTEKARRFCQLRQADLKPREKKPKPRKAPLSAAPRTFSPTWKEASKKAVEEETDRVKALAALAAARELFARKAAAKARGGG